MRPLDHFERRIGIAMAKHGQFITLGRSVIAYPIAMAAGAMTFLPVLIAGNRLASGVVAEHGSVLSILRFVGAELGTALLGLVIFALPVFPFYIAGMIVAMKVGTRHWLYFATMGAALSIGLWACLSFLPPRTHTEHFAFRVLIRLVVPVGAVGGLACWLFLYLTWPRETK
ncbi:hypothetical protein [Paraburkholderia nemoris]|nr:MULTISPECIES: hypothetical protein [Paraburkholderia]KPD19634.1 hypothetical protein ADM96_04050 [Burkholderia sp. ST111]MBK3812601.1 hypothetical protein [Paraburkholderia aspalathi]